MEILLGRIHTNLRRLNTHKTTRGTNEQTHKPSDTHETQSRPLTHPVLTENPHPRKDRPHTNFSASRLGSIEPGDKTGLRLSPHLAPSTFPPLHLRTLPPQVFTPTQRGRSHNPPSTVRRAPEAPSLRHPRRPGLRLRLVRSGRRIRGTPPEFATSCVVALCW